MAQAACLPSLTDSTVVLANPARSPPQNTPGSLVDMVSGSTSGIPQVLSFTGDRAATTGEGGPKVCFNNGAMCPTPPTAPPTHHSCRVVQTQMLR